MYEWTFIHNYIFLSFVFQAASIANSAKRHFPDIARRDEPLRIFRFVTRLVGIDEQIRKVVCAKGKALAGSSLYQGDYLLKKKNILRQSSFNMLFIWFLHPPYGVSFRIHTTSILREKIQNEEGSVVVTVLLIHICSKFSNYK